MTVPPSRRKDRQCRTCPTMIRRDSKTGYCARCVKQSPEYRAKASEIALNRTPEHRAKLAEAVRRAHQADPTLSARKREHMRQLTATPEWKERNAEHCRQRRLWEKGVASLTPESRSRGGRTFSQRHGTDSWCPPEHRQMFEDLLRRHFPAKEAKQIVLDHHEAEMRRFRQTLLR